MFAIFLLALRHAHGQNGHLAHAAHVGDFQAHLFLPVAELRAGLAGGQAQGRAVLHIEAGAGHVPNCSGSAAFRDCAATA